MARIGAKYTVKGYLDELHRLNPADNHNFLNEIFFDKIFNRIDLIESRLKEKLSGWARTFYDSSKITISRNLKITKASYLPRAIEFVTAGTKSEENAWLEPGMMMQLCLSSLERNRYSFDFFPSFHYISRHALERIYERTGGCNYDEFSDLIFNAFFELEKNLSKLVAEGVYVRFESESTDQVNVTAVPCLGGLVVVEIVSVAINSNSTLSPFKISVGPKGASVKKSSFEISSTPNYYELLFDDDLYHINQSYMTRTFISFDDLSNIRRDSLFLLELILKKISDDKIISSSNLERDSFTGSLVLNLDAMCPTPALSGLRADVVQSFDWLKDPGEKFVIARSRE